MNLFVRHFASLLFVVFPMMLTDTAHAQTPGKINLDPPGDREFVLDTANIISDADKQKIKQLGDKLLTDKAAPIIVVTIKSMAQHGGEGMRIETFTRLLFDQWGVGYAKLGKTQWNYGILLLVSQQDRKSRIELGAGWKREKDALTLKIMDEMIIPRFKKEDFSGGIVAGVEGLDKMARDLELPTRSRPSSAARLRARSLRSPSALACNRQAILRMR